MQQSNIKIPLSSQHKDTPSNHISYVTTYPLLHALAQVDHEGENILEQINLTGLNETEKEQRQLFREKNGVFYEGPDDMENVTECRMRINFKDQTPVEKTYYRMPKISLYSIYELHY